MSAISLNIRSKLGAVIALLCVPIVLLGVLLFQQSSKDAQFAGKEREGVTYLRGVWPVMKELTASIADASSAPSARPTSAALESLRKNYDGAFETSESAGALTESLRTLGWFTKPVVPGEQADKAYTAARALITKVADGSNLTLDPDLDSFYVMDTLAVKLPDVMLETGQLVALVKSYKARASLTDDEKAEVAIRLSHLAEATEATQGSLASAYKGNADGTSRRNLSEAEKAFAHSAEAFVAAMKQALVTIRDDARRGSLNVAQLSQLAAQNVQGIDRLWQASAIELDRLLDGRIGGLNSRMWSMVGISGALALLGLIGAFLIINTIVKPMRQMVQAMGDIAAGHLDTEVPAIARKDEIGQMLEALRVLQSGLIDADRLRAQQAENDAKAVDTARREAEAKAEAALAQDRMFTEAQRIRVALDNCSTNVMVADVDLNIVYMNGSVTQMMRNAESDLRRVFNGFDANKLLGQNIDIFHKNPAHQRGMLAKLASTYRTSMSVAGRHFDLVANPVLDPQGNRLGSVVEWKDVTAERAAETEINSVVSAAVAGDFTRRISVDGKDGFVRMLAEAMNTLCETTSSALEDFNANLSALAQGDLTRRISKSYSGMFDEVKSNLNETAERLSGIVTEVVVTANEVTSAASEIAAGTNDLSQRTEQQASNLQETAASMEQMASTIRQNADNAEQANQLAISARSIATDGGAVVSRAVDAMDRIEDSSQKISDIIGVIDEIAFQTNLLALNAAVEAARAGDAGKGFAVVASEVRSLAQRSSAAAKDIKTLIVESGGQVKDGVKLVNNAGNSLNEIVSSIKRVADIVSEIAAASKEQSTGVEEINRAVSQMDEMTQQNSALVEENAAASRTLQEQAQTLHQRMSFFTVDANAGSRISAPAYHAPAHKPAPAAHHPAPSRPQPAKKVASGGGVAKMQSDIQSAFENDADWAEF